jgi:hypothetical protein
MHVGKALEQECTPKLFVYYIESQNLTVQYWLFEICFFIKR